MNDEMQLNEEIVISLGNPSYCVDADTSLLLDESLLP
jgi:hypothetical protein